MLVLESRVVSLHSRSVETNIPVGQVFEESKHMSDHVIQAVVVHFNPYIFHDMLTNRKNPPVHDIASLMSSKFKLEIGLEDKSFSGSLFPSSDILNQESVGIEPREEHFTNNTVDAFSSKFERLRSHYGAVAKIESASVSSILICDPHGVRVVFLTLGHFRAVLSQDNSVHNKVLEGSSVLDCC